MRARLLRYWEQIRYSFWFVPALMALGAFVLSEVGLRVDRATGDSWVERIGWLYASGPDGAREVLSAIAGSMITTAGVVFSITIVALSLASQQFGPRLLHTFIRDTGNQIVLGMFIATFLYCLLVLRTIYAEEGNAFIPHLSVAFGVILALASLAVLIYFIHHVSTMIQAPNVIAAVGMNLIHTIDESYPRQLGHDPSRDSAKQDSPRLPDAFEDEAVAVPGTMTGYVQAIDSGTLLHVAKKHDLVLRTLTRPGNFIIKGQTLVLAWPPARAKKSVLRKIQFAFVEGRRRTSTQDVEFALDQLVEVGLRALSPSINDPFTAMSCIDWMSAGLARLARREAPSRYRHDDAGTLRVVAEVSTFEGIVEQAFNQLRQHSRGNVAVTCRLLEAVARVAGVCQDTEWKLILLRHADLIYHGSRDISEAKDRADVEERYQAAVRLLAVDASTPAHPSPA